MACEYDLMNILPFPEADFGLAWTLCCRETTSKVVVSVMVWWNLLLENKSKQAVRQAGRQACHLLRRSSLPHVHSGVGLFDGRMNQDGREG